MTSQSRAMFPAATVVPPAVAAFFSRWRLIGVGTVAACALACSDAEPAPRTLEPPDTSHLDADRIVPRPETPGASPQTLTFDGTIGAIANEDDAAPTAPDVCDGVARSDAAWTPDPGDLVMRDRETGSLWNVNGQAFDGPCRGAQLQQLPAFTVFWFAWSTAHDGGEVWNLRLGNEPGPIESDPSGACGVPCASIRSGGPPPDGIPALDHLGRWDRPKPARMVAADDSAAAYLDPNDIVNGVVIEGEARAYPHSILTWHEIHVDQIGDTEINLTYCPLTGSALNIPVDQGSSPPLYLYVSGRLFNDNLTMFERDVPIEQATFWNQVLRRAIEGNRLGESLEIAPIVETTWERWQQMHPDTLVTDADTGYARSYGSNPYDDDPNANTLLSVTPQWEAFYRNKDRVLAIDGAATARAYPFPEMDAFGSRVVINDVLDGEAMLVVYEGEHRMAIPYRRTVGAAALTFEARVAP